MDASGGHANPMPPKLYLETTIPSYQTALPSRDVVMAARQQITSEWWDKRLTDFDIYISQLVIDEASMGDANAAARRLEAIEPFPLLEITQAVEELAEKILATNLIPPKAARDAVHIALSAVHDVHFLLTWNFKHIANAEISDRILKVCTDGGYPAPVICTPEELLGE